MKTTFYIVAIAFCLCVAWGQMVATPTQTFIANGDRIIMIKGKVAGDLKNWLIIEAHNGAEWKEKGYDPTYVRVVCDYKPMFRKLGSGQYEIMFTSEIAENIP